MLAKLSKYPSAPQKKVSVAEQYNLAPKKSQTLLLKPKVLANTRKVQPLTKEQLEQVFAKYQIKTVSKKDKIDNESVTAGERSTDCRDRKSDSSPEKVQPQNEIPQDNFAVKKLDFERGEKREEENPEEAGDTKELKVEDDPKEEEMVEMTEPAVPLAPDHIEESNENEKVELKEKEEEQEEEEEKENIIQIIDNEKAEDEVEKEFNNEPENQENEEENESKKDENLDVEDDKEPVEMAGSDIEIPRKSDVYEKKHTTTPIILPNSPEHEKEDEVNLVKSNSRESKKVNDSDLEEYNLSLLDDM